MLNQIITHLRELKMSYSVGELEALAKKHETKEEFLLSLLQAESQRRKILHCQRKVKFAKFPFEREWAQIDYKKNQEIPFAEIQKLTDGKFLNQNQNICLYGNSGLGKTHSLIAIGRALCRQGESVQFFTALELATLLEEAQNRGELSKFMEKIKKIRFLIIDELGFVPFSERASRLLFDVFAQRYERGSIGVTTNLSFEKWSQVFGSVELTAALIDRFTHKAVIYHFKGDSVRLMEARSRAKSSGK